MPEAFQPTDSPQRPLRRWIRDLPRNCRRWVLALPRNLQRWIPARARALGGWIAHLPSHFPGAVAVASLVTIGHLHYHLLEAIDGYAFIGIGNLSAIGALSSGAKKPTVAVVVIDQSSYETWYHERSPLSRCQLRDDLKFLYELPIPPRLMVIDLDLSPSAQPEEARSSGDNADCQEKLNQLLIAGSRKTRTVLMNPLPVNDPDAKERTRIWMESMKAANISFGDPYLPIRYGLVTKIECMPEKLAAVALREFSTNSASLCQSKDFLINPKQYLKGLRSVSALNLPLQDTLFAEWPGIPPPWQLQVVFFGGTYGDDDTYLTPLGIMYGVEVHAAAYMSLVEPASEFDHLLGFGLEIGIAVIFGGIISSCWRGYFAMRFSPAPWKRELSAVFVLLLGVLLIILVAGTTVGSLLLLSMSDYWLSPIPIALGMLIESFFVGAVQEAVQEGVHQREDLVRRFIAALKYGPDKFHKAVATQVRQHPRNLGDQLSRFIIGDVARHIGKVHLGAALFLLVRRLLLFFLLGFALFLIFTQH